MIDPKRVSAIEAADAGDHFKDNGTASIYFGLIVFFLAYAVVLTLGRYSFLRDPDTLWHIRTGQWMLENMRWPHADPFSYTFFGRPWIAKEWLSQLILALAFDAGKWRAVVALSAAFYAGIAMVLTIYLTRYLRFSVALGLALVSFLLVSAHALARPHLFAYLILAVWLFALFEAYDNKKTPPLWMAGLMILWANIHSSFLFGLGVFYIVCGFICIDSFKLGDARRLKRTILISLAVTAATCITPYGWGSLLAIWKVVGQKGFMANIQEWQSPQFGDNRALLIYLIALFALIIALGIRLRGPRLVIFVVAMWLGLSYARGFVIFLLVVPFLFAYPTAQQFDYLAAANFNRGKRFDPVLNFLHEHMRRLTAFFSVVAVGAVIVFWSVLAVELPGYIAPREAIKFVRQEKISGNVFNSYIFGGYLIYSGIPTFIDGRAELFGGDFVQKQVSAVNLDDIQASFRMLDEYKIDWVILYPTERLAKALIASSNWTKAYSDRKSVVFVRAKK